MQKLLETLKSFGIEVPEDKHAEVKKALSENYKHIGEFNKTLSRIEADRDQWKDKATTAEDALKSFEGVDPEKIQSELEAWKQKAKEAEENAQKQIYERDYNDTLKAEMEKYKFTSEAAKKAVMGDIKAAELKLKDGKILGLSDLIEQIKAADASAFIDEQQQDLEQNKARFAQAREQASSSAPDLGKLSMAEYIKARKQN